MVTPVVIALELEVTTVDEMSAPVGSLLRVTAELELDSLDGAELGLAELDNFEELVGAELDLVELEGEAHTLLTIFFKFFSTPKISLKLEISHSTTPSIEFMNNLTTLHSKSLAIVKAFLVLLAASPANRIVSPRLWAVFFNSSSKDSGTEGIPLKSFLPITWINAEI